MWGWIRIIRRNSRWYESQKTVGDSLSSILLYLPSHPPLEISPPYPKTFIRRLKVGDIWEKQFCGDICCLMKLFLSQISIYCWAEALGSIYICSPAPLCYRTDWRGVCRSFSPHRYSTWQIFFWQCYKYPLWVEMTELGHVCWSYERCGLEGSWGEPQSKNKSWIDPILIIVVVIKLKLLSNRSQLAGPAT